MESYKEMKARHQKDINELPIHFAFSEKQWRELLFKLGLTDETAMSELVELGGGVVLKKDAKRVIDTFRRISNEESEAMNDMEFFQSAVYYEMCNHEFCINWQGVYDVLISLGFDVEYSDYSSEMLAVLSDEQHAAWKRARAQYMREADEKGWF